MTDKLLVAAIDFGTTFSGYAFSFSHDFKHDPLKISANQWIGGGHISLKTSTTVLFGPDKTFHSFGYEAEDKYTQLAENEEHHDWYFFRRFKMKLHQDKGVSRGMLLTDEHRKTMPALQVFTASIRYLKDHLLTNIHKRVSSIADDDIQWVLTVPAIWSESAKQFMREAAEDAGIDGDKLLLALEPEAASIYCKELPVDKFAVGGPACKSALRPGSKYIVMDIGGGTADFTVHQVTDRGVLREISAASGGPWGGTKVDDAFYNFLASVFGEEILADFCREYTADYLDIMREFEVKKRTVNPSTDGKTTMRIPVSLFDLFRKRKGKTFAQAHEGTPVADKVTARRDKMQFRADVFKSFFKDCIQGIIDHVKDIFTDDSQEIENILMVGGFSECEVLQEAIRENFGERRIIVPNEAGLSVLKGAVLFGHRPSVIGIRISKYSYGVEVEELFIEGLHKQEYKYFENDTVKCRHVFEPFVKIGDRVPSDAKICQEYVTNMIDVQEGAGVFASTDINSQYTTDSGCFKLGRIKVDAPGHRVKVEMCFGGTEFTVQITDLVTGVKRIKCYDFLATEV